MIDVAALAARLAAHPHVTGKRDIDLACAALGLTQDSSGRPGDDAAAIPDGDGWQLMATEGFMNDFVAAAPWFAGWCAVMVNMSDILAMGGRPTAVTNALWAPDAATAAEILRGMREASAAYGIPIVGGHTNLRTAQPQLAAAIWGRARALITSFDAKPGDVLIASADLRGAYAGESSNFPAFLNAPHARLRGDMEILPGLAEDGLVTAGKDISQGGSRGHVRDAGGMFRCGHRHRPRADHPARRRPDPLDDGLSQLRLSADGDAGQRSRRAAPLSRSRYRGRDHRDRDPWQCRHADRGGHAAHDLGP